MATVWHINALLNWFAKNEKVTAAWLDRGTARKLVSASSRAREIWLSRPAHVWGLNPSFPL